jgi:hypothetical protein
MENRRKSKSERERLPGLRAGNREVTGPNLRHLRFREPPLSKKDAAFGLVGHCLGNVLFGKSRPEDKIIDGAPNSD